MLFQSYHDLMTGATSLVVETRKEKMRRFLELGCIVSPRFFASVHSTAVAANSPAIRAHNSRWRSAAESGANPRLEVRDDLPIQS